MTGDQQPTTPPRAAVAYLDIANLAGDLWCEACKALTGFSADVVALHPGGMTVVGTVTGCVICVEPDGLEARRG